jgi:spore coat polysaccharide biosynthesis predicted glycosyltransferase SpsG
MKKKVILIRVNLSPKLGAGHFIRMIAFADLLKNNGYNINFISSSENKESINSILNDKYPIIFTDKSDALEDAKFIIDVATKYTAKLVIFDGTDFTEEYDIILREAKLKTLHVVDVPNRVY